MTMSLPRIGTMLAALLVFFAVSSCGYNNIPTSGGAGQGEVGGRAEQLSAPRRPHPQSGRDRAGLRQAGEGRADRGGRGARQGDAGAGSTPRSSPIRRSSSSSRTRRTSSPARSAGCSAISENYPDLKSNQNFLALQSQLEGTENRIAVARRDYIEAVRAYNTELKTFPGVLVGRDLLPLQQADGGVHRQRRRAERRRK